MTFAQELLLQAKHLLKLNDISTPELDAKVLLKEALYEKNYNFIIANSKIPMSAELRFKKMINKRRLGEPVSRIISKRSFWNSDFFINPSTLDPRSDSEILVSSAIKMSKNINSKPIQILDLGTGSGCLILSLLQSIPDSKGVGSDINSESLKVAEKNAANLKLNDKVKFILSDWGKNIESKFDIIISNPPYVKSSEIKNLQKEVKNHDPIISLDGGSDGLLAYYAIGKNLLKLIEPKGLVLLEIGYLQEIEVINILRNFNFKNVAIEKDLSNITRCLVFSLER